MPAARVTSANDTAAAGAILFAEEVVAGTRWSCFCRGSAAAVIQSAAPMRHALALSTRKEREVGITGRGRWPFLPFAVALFSVPRSVATPAAPRLPCPFFPTPAPVDNAGWGRRASARWRGAEAGLRLRHRRPEAPLCPDRRRHPRSGDRVPRLFSGGRSRTSSFRFPAGSVRDDKELQGSRARVPVLSRILRWPPGSGPDWRKRSPGDNGLAVFWDRAATQYETVRWPAMCGSNSDRRVRAARAPAYL